MRNILSAVLATIVLSLTGSFASRADSSMEFSVQASASVQASPARITLSWPQDTFAVPTSYTVFRRAPGAASWSLLATLPGSQTTYVDSTVAVGTPYEYQIVKKGSNYTGYGYLYAGINLPLIENRGRLLLVVENTHAASLSNELARLRQDLVGDGWTVTRIDVNRNDTPVSVKNLIRTQYNADPANVKAVFLFGRVPVPYSGDIVPDGHSPEHRGAWPADGYYGDMDGTWTDGSVNNTGASDARTRNVPGDGKFDQSTFPAPLKLMVGRVDLANMPGRLTWGGPATFPAEVELLRNYLNKDHNFRHRKFTVPRRGIVGDYFGSRQGEAFGASGWRNLSAFFGASNVTSLPNTGTWVPTLKDNPYLFAYGCGSGSYTSIGGLGNTGVYKDGITTELVQNDVKAVFTMLFGSWLGDWDSEDNIQRAVLALPSYGLTCSWSGRPHWFLQHMALGEPIGFSTRLTQNNGPGGLYLNQVNSGAGWVHIALMGDPTLRLHPVAPPSSVTAASSGSGVTLNWTASPDSPQGYHVYRAASASEPFTRVTTSLVTGTSFTDTTAAAGTHTYMVRAVKLETSASGTYFNPSQGAFTGAASTGTGTGGSTDGGSTSTNSTGGNTSTNTIPSTSTNVVAGDTIWFDDTLPGNAVPGGTWNWITSNPTPRSGKAHQTAIGTGLHQHYFDWAFGNVLNVEQGDILFTYIYIDPANVPSQIMLQWNDGTWEHRAYWGANNISMGVDGTVSRRHMGPLPATGKWVRLEVPANQVGLEGRSVKGMAFSLFGGRAAWDETGKATAGSTTPDDTTPNPGTGTGTNTNVINSIWFDDALPNGAVPGADGGDGWNWVSNNPAPISGKVAHQSNIAAGMHQHYFDWARETMTVRTGDVLFAYVYLDPSNLPSQLMLQWNDGNWNHRAYWGANTLTYGTDGTASRRYVGPLPAAGQWARLEVPASQVGLEGSTVRGMAFTLVGGRATWDSTGTANGLMGGGSGSNTNTNGSGSTTNNTGSITNITTTIVTNVVDTKWVDDSLPAGATPLADGGDAWTWITANPAPQSGTRSHQSNIKGGMHQHYFVGASQGLQINAGDRLYAYVYLDPANMPSQVMLQWNDGNWEHRAYWGANKLQWGANNTAGRRYIGPLPPAGQWVRLEVPADQVGLEGATVRGMAFALFDGRATWDNAGKSTTQVVTNTVITVIPGTGGTNTPPSGTNTPPTGTNQPPDVSTNQPPATNLPPAVTNIVPGLEATDNIALQMPRTVTHSLRVLSPTLLELTLINTKDPDPARVSIWDFVNSSSQFTASSTASYVVTVNGKSIPVQSAGFKRRPFYAPLVGYDLRIENAIYLQLASPISDNQNVEVTNPGNTLWPSSMKFVTTMNPLRFNPAIHVNHEGYMPGYSKKAMIGYYLGNIGEMTVTSSSGFQIVDANTGATVHQGTLTARPDAGWAYTPTPYQKVLEADFTGFNTPGAYRLVVPGLGGSLPFHIHHGVAMNFARTYALGIYHQRCGTSNSLPFTRHTHDRCHHAAASVPTSETAFPFTWNTVANYARSINANNPAQVAPLLTNIAAQRFPFAKSGTVDVSGGHHDAGDYSKYTLNSVALIHYLVFAVDSIAGAGDLDNLGLPESGDGISDLLQTAKWESDFLAKLQDSDGGFYFLVYPQNRAYESNVTPDKGDPQVVWPKTSSATAASVAALAECASSPAFKKAYPQAAAAYLEKAKLGWQFLMNGINKHGRNGIYQKITHYGDDFTDQDELAWAAAAMFAATGEAQYHQALMTWFPDPTNPATFRWGWWKMFLCYGNAIRTYGFAVKSGRLQANQVDSTYLAKCHTTITTAGNDMVRWSKQSAYGTSFPEETKRVRGAGWYFSGDQAFDLAVAYQIDPKQDYLDAIIANMNYEGGCNPVNMAYVTGMGWKRQRDAVSQYAANDHRLIPPSGQPIGNVQGGFAYLNQYGAMLSALAFPSDNAASAPYPFYDRWADSWNVTTEFVTFIQARALATYAFLAARSPLKSQGWKSSTGTISVPTTTVSVGKPVTLTLTAPGLDLSSARIVWEARDQDPFMGSTFTFSPKNNGIQWVEAEAQLPDGRRVFASGTFNADSANIVWIDDALPTGAVGGGSGGDTWNWITSNPAPFSGTKAHQSALASGLHQHYFDNAASTMTVGTGTVLYAHVYIDPANPPAQLMLQWNDGTWEHRAYWGANNIGFGTDGTASKRYMGPLPEAGKWVQLKVPASQVGLEGRTVKGMGFAAFNGRVTWDATGVLNPAMTQ